MGYGSLPVLAIEIDGKTVVEDDYVQDDLKEYLSGLITSSFTEDVYTKIEKMNLEDRTLPTQDNVKEYLKEIENGNLGSYGFGHQHADLLYSLYAVVSYKNPELKIEVNYGNMPFYDLSYTIEGGKLISYGFIEADMDEIREYMVEVFEVDPNEEIDLEDCDAYVEGTNEAKNLINAVFKALK